MRVAELGGNFASQVEQVIGSGVTVVVSGCRARLRGRVPSDATRQAILEIIAELAPWLNVIDELELAPSTGVPGRELQADWIRASIQTPYGDIANEMVSSVQELERT